MADEENSGTIFDNESTIGGRRRHGSRSEFDMKPGSIENSKRYDRLYNPQGENEYTNQPENPNQIEEAHFLRRRNEYIRGLRSELGDAMRRVQFWPNVGRFIIPKQNTFASHLALVREGNTVDIQFDPKTYLYFDKIIASHANRPELFNPNHKDYLKYEPLRENLAVLRNDIMGIYMEDGSFDPGDEKYLPKLVQIAKEIGNALYVSNTPSKALFASLDKDIVNVEGEGAAHVYKFLEQRQTQKGWLGNIIGMVLRLFGRPDNQWQLPPADQTAFSDAGLSAPAVRDELCNCSHSALQSRCAELSQEMATAPSASREDVESITNYEKHEAVHHGHVILDWLRNIKFSDKSLMDLVDTGNPAQTAPEVNAMNMMIDAYYSIASTAFQSQPELFNNPKVQAANEALETLEHGIALMAKLEKPKSLADTMQISADVTQQPEKWHELAGQTVDRLMQTLKGGLEAAVGSMEAQQQDAAQEQEEAADRQVELALANHAAFGKGRKRRKQRSSGQGAAKQKRIDLAIKADDYALGEGAHAGRKDISRDGIVDSLQKPNTAARLAAAQQAARANASSEADATLAQLKLQNQELGAQAQTQPTQIDNALVKQIGKAMLQMQRDSDAAAVNLPPEVVNAVKEQTNTQRVSESKNNPKRPRIG